MKTTKVLLLLLAINFVFIACAKPPTEEMDAAKAAIEQAEADNDVKLYAVSSLNRAKDMYNNMLSAAEQKLYDQAKQMANETVNLANQAIADGKNAAKRELQDAQNAITAMLSEIQKTNSTIESARAAKKPLDFASIDKDFANAKAKGAQAQSELNQKKYREARADAESVRAQLSDINAKIGQSVLSQSRKK